MEERCANTIAGLLRKRDSILGEMAELRERMAQVTHGVEAVDRVRDALGYDGDPEGRTGLGLCALRSPAPQEEPLTPRDRLRRTPISMRSGAP